MTRGKITLLTGLTMALALLAPSVASAAIRSMTIDYARPENKPSLVPSPPETQLHEYPEAITVAYNDQTGAIGVHLRIFDAPTWATDLPDSVFTIGDDGCENDFTATLQGRFSYHLYDEGSPEVTATLERDGYAGKLTGTVTPAADGFDASYPPNPALAGLPMTCASADFGWTGDGDAAFFTGYKPFELAPENATSAFKDALAAKYGRNWTGASKSWAKCPSVEFFPEGIDADPGGDPQALCQAEWRYAGRWHALSIVVSQGPDGVVLDSPHRRIWTRHWRKLSSKCLAQVDVRGRVYSNDGTCPALMVSDLAWAVDHHKSTRRTGLHGTNRAGFETVVVYRCRRHGKTITCTNGMGDAFKWTR